VPLVNSIIKFKLPSYHIFIFLGYVFEAYDHTNKRKVALKRIEKVGDQLSREFEILFDIKDCNNVVKILVIKRLILCKNIFAY